MEAFKKDTAPRKLSLSVGAYRDAAGKPYYLPSVREAEHRILADPTETQEYPGMAGYPRFCAANNALLFGANAELLKEGRAATVQCISGSGALRIGAEFLARHHSTKTIYIPEPSWANHYSLFPDAGM